MLSETIFETPWVSKGRFDDPENSKAPFPSSALLVFAHRPSLQRCPEKQLPGKPGQYLHQANQRLPVTVSNSMLLMKSAVVSNCCSHDILPRMRMTSYTHDIM